MLSSIFYPLSSIYRYAAYGIRTRVTALRGRRPGPLDECGVLLETVPKVGVEPTRGNPHYALNVARLPVPPLRLKN